jgi:hypothetical protein
MSECTHDIFFPATPGITVLTYDDRIQAWHPRPSIFLAGATTSAKRDGQARVGSHVLSTWRAEVISLLHSGGFRGLVIVPEFANKGNLSISDERQTPGTAQLYRELTFEQQAAERWGHTKVPDGVLARPASWGAYLWERDHLDICDVRVVWADFRDSGKGLGINARPEAQGLLEQHLWRRSKVQPLVMGISPECTGKTRFEALAHEAGFRPARTIPELVSAILAQCAAGAE